MIEDLERQGLIRRFPIEPKRISDSLDLAGRDLKVARATLETDSDWAFTIAYNAILQAGRALMFSQGYRPDGPNQHVPVVRFSEGFLSGEDGAFFDRMRRKRNNSVYDAAGCVSENEAEYSVQRAEELVGKIAELIARSCPPS